MAPNPKTQESLMFLFLCVNNIKDNSVDFQQVAAATNLKVGAVRMRYSRLKKQLEGELVDGKFDLTKGNADSSEPTTETAAETVEEPVMTAAPPAAPVAKKKRGAKRKKTVASEEDA